MNIEYMGENAISYLIEKCKSTFALITHKHTAQEVGADVEGSASAALVLAEQYTDEAVAQKSQVQMVKVNETDSETETLSTLKIHKLTRSQYEQMVEDGTIDENSIYLTQDDDYSNEDLDKILANKSDVNHNHDNIYETKEDAQLKYDELMATKADKEHTHSWNDLTDRPFGEEVVEDVVFIEEITANFVENAGSYHPNTTSDVDISQVLVEGETYTVVWDGVRYENLVGTKGGINNSVTLGSLDGSFSDYPFFLTVDEVMNFGEVNVWCNSAGNHSFAIYKTNKNLKTLDEQYISNEIARTEYVDANFALKSDLQNIDLSSLETKEDSQSKLDEAKAYADSAASTVKNDLLNGAGEAYDSLKELSELIDENQDAIGALETVAANKADKEHDHEGVYEEVGSIELAKAEIKAYVDEALASKIVVQIHTWEADD